IREKDNPEKVLTDLLEIRIINLKRIREAYQKDKDSKKNQWVMFLEDPNSREVQEIMEKNEDVKKAVVTVREMSEDEKMERLAELRQKAIMDEKALYNTGIREGKELGRAEGEKIGEQKGEQKNKIEVIKRMLNANLGIDLIKECTNATDEEIEEAKISKK
ncbi:MAG: Rpn family recombination-promoting nuclease/putative transposase, partial [Clostridia bacterium]